MVDTIRKGVPSKKGTEAPDSSGRAFPVKIGLEVHGYLDTKEKLFCMCRTAAGSRSQVAGRRSQEEDEVNSRICPICTGTPGSKPMAVNEEAVRKMLQIAVVFKSKINMSGLVWQRKHYDWADNPKGYQTTMSGPHSKVNAVGGKFKGINITEIHLEEDPAQWNPDTGRINYNRSGLPLIEMVTEPEFSGSEQVVEWLKSLLLSLSYIKAVRKNAGIKVDVNVSTYGERVEMKNLNSLEKIRKAIDYEVARQVEAFGSRKSEVGSRKYMQERETRAYDEAKGITVKMRSKEGASDYRFIPCPDLAELKVDKKMLNEVKASMPEMPEVKLERLLKEHKVGESDAKILTKNLELVDFFEELVNLGKGKVGTRMNSDELGFKKGNVIIVHGSNPTEKGSQEGLPENERHWKSWLKKKLEKRGFSVSNELYPEDWLPSYEKWKVVFEKNKINENSILIGHSAGTAFLLRWLGENKKKVDKVILVAPSIIRCGKYLKESNLKNFDIDFSLKKYFNELVMFYSDDDYDFIIGSAKKIYSKIGGKLIELKDKGHFIEEDMGTKEFPELLGEILGEEEIEPRTSTDEHGLDVKKMIPWVTIELLRVLNYNKKSLEDEDVEILPEHLAELIKAVEDGEITKLKGKQIMNDFVPKSFSLKDHKEEISSISEEAVENLCRQVIAENGHVVEEYRGGKAASLNFLIGGVMRLSERRADFQSVTEVMKRLIG